MFRQMSQDLMQNMEQTFLSRMGNDETRGGGGQPLANRILPEASEQSVLNSPAKGDSERVQGEESLCDETVIAGPAFAIGREKARIAQKVAETSIRFRVDGYL